ncbi:hypothetical protein [Lactobacillus helveticus]|uniref:hypothetical protein n=1 Tax=Lactobacillus helveticus TaxID=1587 RepID=UPI0021A3E7EE|nr:hypothetical protein [Lactobacillus helveticus]MCT3400943.1 hypothetical protein [Lactobacillus helveticus]
MKNRTLKIVFKDNTSITFKDKAVWLSDVADGIKHAMALKLPYLLNSQDNPDDILIIPTEEIKYIRIIDKPDKAEKEHKNDRR